jgi:hypothetical protein
LGHPGDGDEHVQIAGEYSGGETSIGQAEGSYSLALQTFLLYQEKTLQENNRGGNQILTQWICLGNQLQGKKMHAGMQFHMYSSPLESAPMYLMLPTM